MPAATALGALGGFATGLYMRPEIEHRRALQTQKLADNSSIIARREVETKQQQLLIEKLADEIQKIKATNTKESLYKYFGAYEESGEIKYLQAAFKTMKDSEFIESYNDIARVDIPTDDELISPDKLITLSQKGATDEQIKSLIDASRKKYVTATYTNGTKDLISIPELYGATNYGYEIQKKHQEAYKASMEVEKGLAEALKARATASKDSEEAEKLRLENKTTTAMFSQVEQILADTTMSPADKIAATRGIMNRVRGKEDPADIQKVEYLKELQAKVKAGTATQEDYDNAKNIFGANDKLPSSIAKVLIESKITGESPKEILRAQNYNATAKSADVIAKDITDFHKTFPMINKATGKPVESYLYSDNFPATKFFEKASANPKLIEKVNHLRSVLATTPSATSVRELVGGILTTNGTSNLKAQVDEFENTVSKMRSPDGKINYNLVDGIIGGVSKYFGLSGVNEEAKKKLINNENYIKSVSEMYRTFLKIQSGATVSDKEAADMVKVLGSIYTNPRVVLSGMYSKFNAIINGIREAGLSDRAYYNLTYKKTEEQYVQLAKGLKTLLDKHNEVAR